MIIVQDAKPRTGPSIRREGWVNIHRFIPENVPVVYGPYRTEQEAHLARRKSGGKYLDTVRIEWNDYL